MTVGNLSKRSNSIKISFPEHMIASNLSLLAASPTNFFNATTKFLSVRIAVEEGTPPGT